MKIQLQGIAKRFNYEWIFRGIDWSFEEGNVYAVTGPNGSGKSTLLRIIAGLLTPSEGSIQWTSKGVAIEREDIFRQVSITGPYIELIQEFTLYENIAFHHAMQPFRNAYSISDVLHLSGLEKHSDKTLRYFSSGMLQRLKTSLALLADTSIVLLDEPATNLDEKGVDWYLNLLAQEAKGRVVIIASNQEREYSPATKHYRMPA
jgi:ABC-type multidrug transport system ATPase subunit